MDQEQERALLRKRSLGVGLACPEILPEVDIGRDLSLVQGPNGLDLERVEGGDTLAQDLQVALTTRLGDDFFNTSFGFDGLNAVAEETNPVLMRERVRVAVIQVLRKDPRVRQILDVKLDDGRLDFIPAGSRVLNVRVVFETITADQAALDIARLPQ